MQYSPLQTEKRRVSEWGSSDARFFIPRIYLSSHDKYDKMYKNLLT